MRPRRQVIDGPGGYRVEPDGWTSTDRVLATEVARELDRVDSLPCRHRNGKIVASVGPRWSEQRSRWTCCGELAELTQPSFMETWFDPDLVDHDRRG